MNRKLIAALSIIVVLTLFFIISESKNSKQIGESKDIILYVASYAGQYEDTLKKNVHIFEKENDCTVIFVPVSAMDAVIKVRAGERLDVVHLDPIWSFRGQAEGLFAKLDDSIITNMRELYPVALLSECTVAPNIGAYGIAYNPKFVSREPDSWNVFLDLEYKGRIGMRSFMADSIELLVMMAKINGGDEDNIDPGFTKMRDIGKNIHTWWKKHPECLELFQREEIFLSLWTDGRTEWAKSQGANVKFVLPKEGSFPLVSTVNVVEKSRNKQLAMKYVNFLLSIQSGEDMAEIMGYFPTNKNITLPDEIQEKMAYTPENAYGIQIADWEKIIPKMDEWSERWEREIIQ